MLDITSLERRWFKYKIKKYFPYLLTAFIIIIGGILFSLYLTLNSSQHTVVTQVKVTPAQPLPTPLKVEDNNADMILEPSMQFIETIASHTNEPEVTAAIPATQPTPKKVILPTKAPIVSPKPLPKPILPPSFATTAPPPPPSKPATIKHEVASFDIRELEERFKTGSNPHLGLYIARYYYERGDYSEAYNYALKTNAINNSIEESWLIFAKSLIQLGRSDQARKTLQLYISQSNSESAKALLNTLPKEGAK